MDLIAAGLQQKGSFAMDLIAAGLQQKEAAPNVAHA
jgi:hypothetical protein